MHSFLKSTTTITLSLAMALAIGSCTKVERDDNFPEGDAPPVAGGFTNSSEVSPANLVAHFTFDGTVADAKGGVTGGTLNNGGSFTTGRKGLAYTPTITDPVNNRTNTFISYTNPGPVATLTSFTVSMWINTSKHNGGAQGIFTLAKEDGSFWGNFFLMHEGNQPDNKMFMKLHIEKNNAPFVEHWIEPHGFGPIDYRPDDMYNAWRHIAWSYDAATSKVGFFVNGQKRALPPGSETRNADGSGTLLGPLNFKNPTKFIIGGMQNHLGAPFNTPEPWMLNFTGKIDEFRIYNKALSEIEISAIQVLERQGR